MRKLLLAGAAIDITDHKGNTPLHIAAKFSSTRPLEEIMKYISIQTILEVAQIRNNDGLSCVHVAAKNGNMEILRKLQYIGIDMDMQVCPMHDRNTLGACDHN
jgi:ankyrin repeat protein